MTKSARRPQISVHEQFVHNPWQSHTRAVNDSFKRREQPLFGSYDTPSSQTA